MERLTDRDTAEALRANAEKLLSKGMQVNISDLRYIKLAGYENEQERREMINPAVDDIDGWYE
jgi:hypothetical protein